MLLTNETDADIILTSIILGAIGILTIIFIVLAIINKKKNDKVKKISPYYLEIEKIYNETHFYEVSMRYSKDSNVLNSKKKFDNFNYSKRCSDYIYNYSSAFIDIVDAIEYNKATLTEYKKKIAAVPHTNNEELAKSIKLSLKSMVDRETKLASKLVKNPVIDYQIKITASYTSPKGRNSYRWSNTFDYSFIKRNIESMKQKTINSYVSNVINESKPKTQEKLKPVAHTYTPRDEVNDGQVHEQKTNVRPTNSPKTSKVINSIDDLEEID